MKGPVPEGELLIPLGVADVKREGADITFVSWGPVVHDCLKAAERLAAENSVRQRSSTCAAWCRSTSRR